MPFFVYGTLKHDELGHRQIVDVVSRHQAVELPGFDLFVRDGLPGILPNPGAVITGELIFAADGAWGELNDRIREFEPDGERELYKRATVPLASGQEALTHLFRRELRGHPDYWQRDRWTIADDPLLRYGFPEILRRVLVSAPQAERQIDSGQPEFWTSYLPALGDFLTLTGVLERCATLALGPGDPTRNIVSFSKLPEARRAAAMAPPPMAREVYSSRDLALKTFRVETAWTFWYQVRSNAVHRGKSSFRDAPLVASSARGLAVALFEFLSSEVDGLSEAWQREPTPPPTPAGIVPRLVAVPSSDVDTDDEYEG
jgi:gamma-glutamylcyclotransferase (GGCT)/AIG2-like uncharacterized protein YtfP